MGNDVMYGETIEAQQEREEAERQQDRVRAVRIAALQAAALVFSGRGDGYEHAVMYLTREFEKYLKEG